MEKEHFNFQMDANIMEISKTTNITDKGLSQMMMGFNTKENGKMENY